MQIPQALPVRSVSIETDDAEALSVAQPERGRHYVRLHAGTFQGALHERSDGVVAVARERWSSALRVRCARPRSYIVFSAVASEGGSWCGVPLEGDNVLTLQRDWEITTRGALDASSFAVERGSLERFEALLGGGDGGPRRTENHVLDGVATSPCWLRERVANALAAATLPPASHHVLVGEFLHLAATLRRSADPRSTRLESWSRRRAAVRRVEEYLDAHERELPSLAELCAVAATSERTLEYAFREQLGVTPLRFLRLRRLNRVASELRAGERGATQVTEVAMRWGFWQLGRFAAEYRAQFGERPSETLARSAGRREEIGEAEDRVDSQELDALQPV
jgi:AraC family ethanolamine operon transcriptional activator